MRFTSFISEQKKTRKTVGYFMMCLALSFSIRMSVKYDFFLSLSSEWLAISSLDYYVLDQMSKCMHSTWFQYSFCDAFLEPPSFYLYFIFYEWSGFSTHFLRTICGMHKLRKWILHIVHTIFHCIDVSNQQNAGNCMND